MLNETTHTVSAKRELPGLRLRVAVDMFPGSPGAHDVDEVRRELNRLADQVLQQLLP